MDSQRWNFPNPDTKAISARQDDGAVDGAICLPSDLVAAAPTCALGCIQDFAKANYPQNTCPFTSSLTFLCTSRTTSGLTIGEGSLQCLVSRCTGNDLLRVGVYNVCDSVPGAVPKTFSVITATLEPATTSHTMGTPLPSTIGSPSTTQEVTSIVMASGVPQMAPPTAALSITTDLATTSTNPLETSHSPFTSTSRRLDPTSSPVAVADRTSPQSGLSTPQIAGVGVGAGVITLIILALVFYHCRRREKLQRRRSVRWSMHGPRTPPYRGAPPDLPVKAKTPDNDFLSPLGSSQRYYSSGPPEEKRRSFWRRSIKPEDIGVAVSAHALEDSSPTSFSSQQSMAKLLPKIPEKLPTRAAKTLWPAPLNFDSERTRQSNLLRPTSQVTVFDEDLEANTAPHPARISEARDSRTLMYPSKGRQDRVLPAPLQLNPVTQENFGTASREADQSSTAQIPLTPTYDNGNIVNNTSRMHPPSSWRQGRQPEQLSPPPLSALPEELSPRRNAQLNKNVLRKKPTTRTANKSGRSEVTAPAAFSKPVPVRKDSETTAATEIEDDTPAEEADKQLEIVEKPKPAPIFVSGALEATEGPRSPISNLRYPRIPRSAAVSRNAELVPQPLKSLEVPALLTQPAPARPTRDQLVRNESSFMVTDNTSSDGYLSDQSIEWPVPPNARSSQNLVKTGIARLRKNPSSANRGGRGQIGRSMNQVLLFGTRSSSLQPPPFASTSKAELTSQAPNWGDLYFTVEM